MEASYSTLLDPLGERRRRREADECEAEQESLAKQQRLDPPSERESESDGAESDTSDSKDSAGRDSTLAVYSDGLSAFDSSDEES